MVISSRLPLTKEQRNRDHLSQKGYTMHTFRNEWTDEQGNRPMSDYDVGVPSWIEKDICVYTVDAIRYGGCSSGAYMPACFYSQASDTMNEHGDDILQYIQNHEGELPKPPEDPSWSELACFYLQYAVELWAHMIDEDIDPNDFFPEDEPEDNGQ